MHSSKKENRILIKSTFHRISIQLAKAPGKLFLVLLFLMTMTSCQTVLLRLYGVKNYKTVDEELIFKKAKQYNVPKDKMYYADSSYFAYFRSLDTTRKQVAKDRQQPLQACYYDRAGNLISFQINCYAGGFPNLKWNRNGIFKTFVPKQQAPLDTLLSLDQHLEFISPISDETVIPVEEYDYVVLVHWTVLFGRQSKRLIRFVQKNAQLAGDKKVDIRYVNMEMMWM